MKKIVEYTIATNYNGHSIDEAVNELISDGFEPHGSLVVEFNQFTNTYFQPMVRYENV